LDNIGIIIFIIVSVVSFLHFEKNRKKKPAANKPAAKKTAANKPASNKQKNYYDWPLKAQNTVFEEELLFNSVTWYTYNWNADAISFFIRKLYDMGRDKKKIYDNYITIAYIDELRNYKSLKQETRDYLYNNMDEMCTTLPANNFLIILHYYDFNDMDEILRWCRIKTNAEKAQNSGGEGYVLAWHFMVLAEFLPERETGESMRAFLKRIANKYDAHELWALHAYKEEFQAPELKNEKVIADNLIKATKSGNYLAKLIGPVKRAFVMQWASSEDRYNLVKDAWEYNVSKHRAVLRKETQSLDDDWYEKAQTKAKEYAGYIRKGDRNHRIYLYWQGITCYSLGDEENAISCMILSADYGYPPAINWLASYHIEGHDYYCLRSSTPDEILYSDGAKEKSIKYMLKMAGIIKKQDFKGKYELVDHIYTGIKNIGTEEALFTWLRNQGPKEYDAAAEEWISSTDNSPQAALKKRLGYLAKALRYNDVENILAFIDHDLDKTATDKFCHETNGELLKKAFANNLKAIADLGSIYSRKEGPEMYRYKSMAETLWERVSYAYEYRYENGTRTDQDIIDWYLFENAYRERRELSYDIFKIGLGNHIPYFCVKSYWLRDELGLTMSDVYRYIEIAEKQGYDVDSELADIREDYRSWRRQQQAEIDKKAEEERRKQAAKRAEFDAKMDMLERDIDRMNGGDGYTVEEKAAAGIVSPLDHRRNQDLRDRLGRPKK